MAFYILYTIEDRDGKDSNTEIKIPDSALLSNAAIFAAEMAQLIDPLIRGVIRRIGIAFLIDMAGVTGIKTAALAGADVEEGAKFGFRTAANFFTGLRLPTFDEAFIIDGTDQVDTEDPDVAAFVTAMVSGIDLSGAGGTGTISPTTNREEDLVALTYAQESFTSSRKAR
jgi:hypothetical protein